MNNRTRKEIDEIIKRIYSVQADIKAIGNSGEGKDEMISDLNDLVDEVNDIQTDIQDFADEEQDKYDNLPENLQYSERGEAFEEAADALNDAAGIDDTPIQDIIEALENGQVQHRTAISV